MTNEASATGLDKSTVHPFSIAVIDRQGTIVFNNKAWSEFGKVNGARSIPSFSHEYPCHSPVEQQWLFRTIVTRALLPEGANDSPVPATKQDPLSGIAGTDPLQHSAKPESATIAQSGRWPLYRTRRKRPDHRRHGMWEKLPRLSTGSTGLLAWLQHPLPEHEPHDGTTDSGQARRDVPEMAEQTRKNAAFDNNTAPIRMRPVGYLKNLCFQRLVKIMKRQAFIRQPYQ